MTWPSNQNGSEGLVVVFTKDNVHRLKKLGEQYRDPPLEMVLLDDSTSSKTRDINRRLANSWDVEYHGPEEQSKVFETMQSRDLITPLGSSEWTLGYCRNYALIMSLINGWDKMIMVDDDIDFRSWDKINQDLYRLNNYPIVGANIVNMPDSSIVGYLFRSSGIIDETFLSGSYLAIDLTAVEFPFPNIYNEDWIWIFLHQSKSSVPIFGSVTQLEYDWTEGAVDEAIFQELGETAMEGLLKSDRRNIRYNINDQEFWEQAIEWRRQKLEKLESRSAHINSRLKCEILENLFRINDQMTPEDVIDEMDVCIDRELAEYKPKN